jgi:tetraacyldisaccharide 4'-kinase
LKPETGPNPGGPDAGSAHITSAGPARATGLRASLETALQLRWFARSQRDLLDPLLAPLSWVVSALAQRRRHRIAQRKASGPAHPQAKVVIFGNLVVGGTGKTPLVIATALALTQRGWRVGLLARGHGGEQMAKTAQQVPQPAPHDAAKAFGDEAIVLAQSTGLPVAAGHDRGAALRALLGGQECDVVLSDDGLQHEGLARDLEIAVFDRRGAGNGRVLPPGPLREPLFNALFFDALLLNGRDTRPPITHSRVFRFTVAAQDCLRMDGAHHLTLGEAAAQWQGERIHALAAIGQPQRFFDDLSRAGLQPHCWALADHACPDPTWAGALPADRILMTSKDAVKCRHWPAALLARCYEVTSRATIDPGFIDWIEERLRGSQMD